MKKANWTPYLALAWLLALAVFAPQRAEAQRDDKADLDQDVGAFRAKQARILELIGRQKPRYLRVQEEIKEKNALLRRVEQKVATPEGLAQNRGVAIEDAAAVRFRADDMRKQVEAYFFKWFEYQSDVAAIYTRAGELKAAGRLDEELIDFITAHRELLQLMQETLDQLDKLYRRCDYLLSVKLE